MNIPVIFFHKGNQDYLRISLAQCRKYNDTVLLLGDETNKNLAEELGCSWYNMGAFENSSKWHQFKKKYLGMSTNDYNFELNCFKRFFVIYEFIRKDEIDKFVYLDSDILTYVDFSSLELFEDYDAGMCVPQKQEPYRWVANCGISLWNQKSLEAFLNYCNDSYESRLKLLEEKWN